MRILTMGLLGTLFALPLAAQQQEKERDVVKMRTPMRVWVNDEDMTPRLEALMQRRARLGISVTLTKQDTDSIGAHVQSVTPGGPAAKAGIRSGDLITRLDGKSILGAASRPVDEEESLPGVRLIELAAKLEPGDTIPVEYSRNGQRRTVSLVTGDEPLWAVEEGPGSGPTWEFRVPGLRMERLPQTGLMPLPEGRGRVEIRRGPGQAQGVFFMTDALGDLELAPLNADLGSYFGTTDGVLVIRVPEGSALGLKGGDVILTVDGRKPSSPASLMRILRSYEGDETIKLEIIRQKKRETVTGKLDAPRSGREE
jgi:S1-C subfamily serine protease